MWQGWWPSVLWRMMLCNIRWLGKTFLIRWRLSRDLEKGKEQALRSGRRASQAKRLASGRLWGSRLLGLFEEYKRAWGGGGSRHGPRDAGGSHEALQAVVSTWGFTRNEIQGLGNLLSKGGHGLSYVLSRSICLIHKGTSRQRWKLREKWKASPGVHTGDSDALDLEGVMSCVWRPS